MAQMTNCAFCQNIILSNKMSCKFYPERIPDDIFLEVKECKFFKRKSINNDNDDDLPIAKGR